MSRTKRVMFYAPAAGWDVTTCETLLLLVERIVPPSVIESWTPIERMLVCDWAISVHLSASDNPVQVRPEPSLLWPYSPDHGEPTDRITAAERLLRDADALLAGASARERQGREVGAARLSIASVLRCLTRRLARDTP